MVCPLNAKVHYNIAKSAVDSGNSEKAINEYREAIRFVQKLICQFFTFSCTGFTQSLLICFNLMTFCNYLIFSRLLPTYDQALNNLANILKSKGEIEEAETLLRRALDIRQEFPAAWMNLGIVLTQRNKFAEAEECYYNALKYRKNYPDCYYNLGNLVIVYCTLILWLISHKYLIALYCIISVSLCAQCICTNFLFYSLKYYFQYLAQNRLKEAEKAWKISIQLRPTFSTAWNNLIILNDNNGNLSKAISLATEALTVLPNDSGIHFNLANALGKSGEFQKSERHFLKALKLNPKNPQYHANLGVLYHRWKKYRNAMESYKKALKLNPTFKSAKENFESLKKKMASIE